jgi:hypothetical protein
VRHQRQTVADIEHSAARTLRRLERRGWRILHDRSVPGSRTARLDHLAIGPAGVAHVAARGWTAPESSPPAVTPDTPRQGGALQPRALRTLAWEAGVVAIALGVPVRALAVVDELPAADAPGGVLQLEEVTVVPLRMLYGHLRGLLPLPGMDVDRVRRLAEHAAAALPPHPG